MGVCRSSWIFAAGAGALIMAGLAVAQPLLPGEPGGNLAVSGKPLSVTQAEFDACLARHCAPPEDIAASIALADNQIAASQWKAADATLEAARDRNRRFAVQNPLEVAGLLRAYRHISGLRGDSEAYRLASIETIDVLTAGLGKDDPRVLMARLEVADVMVNEGPSFMTPRRKYEAVLKEARDRNLPAIEGAAMFRIAAMFTWGAQFDRGDYESRAKAAIDELAASTTPEHAPYAQAAKALRSQLAAFYGDGSAADAEIAQAQAERQPLTLLSYEPIQRSAFMMQDGPHGQGETLDLSFRVAPDGRVWSTVVLLRYTPRRNSYWESAIIKSIQSRHYALLGRDQLDPGALRVERYRVVRDKAGVPVVQMLDMTDPNAPILIMETRADVVDK
jgi:hypothetical protein